MTELALACGGHPSVFSYSVENESPAEVNGVPLISALIDAAHAADPSVPLTTEGSGSASAYSGATATAVNLLHYALPDDTRSHIRAVGECAWCVEDGLESFASLAVQGRLGDVAYYAGWDLFNYWSNFIPGYSAARHAWQQKGCEARDRVDGVDGWGSPLVEWIQAAFSPFFPMDVAAYAANPAFPYAPPRVWPSRVDTVAAGGAVNRTVAVFNDGLRGDLQCWEAAARQRVLHWSTHWDTADSATVASGGVPLSIAPGFHALASVAFSAPAPGGSAPRKLFIRLANAPLAAEALQGELVGVEDKVYILVAP